MRKNFCYALDNSETVYADIEDGSLHLRTGVFKEVDEDGEIHTSYENDCGISTWPESKTDYDIDSVFPIIGKKGDKWDNLKPIQIILDELMLSGFNSYHDMLWDIDQFFIVDKTKAEDRIWLECDADIAGENLFRLDMHSKFFILGGPMFFDYTNAKDAFVCKNEGRHKYLYNMDTVVALLSCYQKWLNKPLTVCVSFAYWTNPFSKEDYIDKKNTHTRMLEEKYAQQIEDYINKGLYDSLHKDDDWENVIKPFERRMQEKWHSERIPEEWWREKDNCK